MTRVRERLREQTGFPWLEQIVQDLKYALRSLSRARGFALVGVVTVALGIGASTAVFSVVDAVLLNPLPFPRAERIVTVWQFDTTAAVERGVSPGNFLEWRDRSTAFDGIAAVEPSGVDIVTEGEPQNLRIWRVSEGFFDILGVPARHGRTFTADEHQPGADGAVVLSQGFWQQRFGGDPGVVGRTLTLSERPYVVVGVMPQQFDYPPGRDLWMSRAFTEDDRRSRGRGFLNVIARLTPGVSVDAARAEMRGWPSSSPVNSRPPINTSAPRSSPCGIVWRAMRAPTCSCCPAPSHSCC